MNAEVGMRKAEKDEWEREAPAAVGGERQKKELIKLNGLLVD